MATTPTPEVARLAATAALRIASLTHSADEAQWSKSPAPVAASTGGGSSSGEVSDPTPNTVADPRRLRLRAAVVAADRELRTSARSLLTASGALDEALEAYYSAD